jgi:hypothetical protein
MTAQPHKLWFECVKFPNCLCFVQDLLSQNQTPSFITEFQKEESLRAREEFRQTEVQNINSIVPTL